MRINLKRKDLTIMGHTPYGYKIENGKAVINEPAATKIRTLYTNYLSGMALVTAAKASGIDTYHGTVKRLLQNRHYIGDDFYPAIIDAATYKRANVELTTRATTMGRLNKVTVLPTKVAPTNFTMKKITNHFPNPLKHAEYLYSLIESEAI